MPPPMSTAEMLQAHGGDVSQTPSLTNSTSGSGMPPPMSTAQMFPSNLGTGSTSSQGANGMPPPMSDAQMQSVNNPQLNASTQLQYKPWLQPSTDIATGKKTLSLNAGNAFNNVGAWLINHKFAGAAVGTGIAHLVQGALDKIDGTNYSQYIPQPTVLQIAADTANLALMAGTGGMSTEAEAAPLLAEESPGLTRTLLRMLPAGNTIKSGMGLGALSGGLQSAASGNTNLGTGLTDAAVGGVMGGLTGGLIHGLSGLQASGEANTGVDTAAANTLRSTPTGIYMKYAIPAVKTQTDHFAPTPMAIMDRQLTNDISTKLEPAITRAGAAKGAILNAEGSTPLVAANGSNQSPILQLQQNFNERLKSMLGYEIVDMEPNAIHTAPIPGLSPNDPLAADLASFMKKNEGTIPEATTPASIVRVEGSTRNMAPGQQSRILAAWQQLKMLAANPTLKGADGVLHNLYDAIDYSKTGDLIPTRDVLESFLKGTAHDIKDSIRVTSPALAAANDTFHNLANTERELASAVGTTGSRAALLLRRVFSGDKSDESNNILDSLRLTTGGHTVVDSAGNVVPNPSDVSRPLIKGGTNYQMESSMADLATATLAHERAQTLFTQGVGKGMGMTSARGLAGQKSAISQLLFRWLEGPVTPDTMDYARSLTQGREGLSGRAYGAVADKVNAVLDSAGMKPALKSIEDEVAHLNIGQKSANEAPLIARQILKMYLIGGFTTPQGGPQSIKNAQTQY